MASNRVRTIAFSIMLVVTAYIPARGFLRSLLMWEPAMASVDSFSVSDTHDYVTTRGRVVSSTLKIEYHFLDSKQNRHEATWNDRVIHESDVDALISAASNGEEVPIYFSPIFPRMSVIAPDRDMLFWAVALGIVLLANGLIWYVIHAWSTWGKSAS